MAGVKMQDIASRIGVSVAAVSMALNGRPGVSDAMRERIIAEAQALGYDMNRLSNAAEKKTRILVFDLDYAFRPGQAVGDDISDIYDSFMRGVEQAASAAGAEITLTHSKSGHLEDVPADVDGVLIINTYGCGTLPEEIAACRCPCVVVGNSYPGYAIPTVSYDNRGAMAEVVRRLAALGHRKIGFVRHDAPNRRPQNYIERYEGWREAVAAAGLEPGPVFCSADNYEVLYTELTGWLPAHLDGATALVTLNDYLGMSIMRALRSCGLTPGADVAVVGFDNRSFAALSDPPLASVQLDESTLSAAGMDYLFSLLRQPGQPVTHRFLPLRFIPRESLGQAR